MDPKQLVATLIERARLGEKGHDLKILENPDGTMGLLFGNQGIQKSYTLHPKQTRDALPENKRLEFDNRDQSSRVYDNNELSLRSLLKTPEDWDSTKNVLLSKITDDYTITQHPDITSDRLATLRKEKDINIPGVPNTLPGEPIKAQREATKEKKNLGTFDPVFDLSNPIEMQRTMGIIGYNTAVRGTGALVQSLYSTAKDLITTPDAQREFMKELTPEQIAQGQIPEDHRGLKDFAKGALGLLGAADSGIKAANQTLFSYFQGDGGGIDKFIEKFQANDAIATEALSNIDALKYNKLEEKLQKETYNDHYLKALEEIKEQNTFEMQQAKGEATWRNYDWLETQVAGWIGSAGEFSLPMVVGNGLAKMGTSAFLRAAGPVAGRGLEKAAVQIAKNKSLETLQKVPKGIRDYVAAPVARAAAALQDVEQMGRAGEALGSTAAMVLNTKFEADLEAFHANKEVMAAEEQRVTQELLESGMPEDQIKSTLETYDWTASKDKAAKTADQVRQANLALLGLSNFATWKLLGLGPKSVVARTYGKVSKESLEKTAPLTAKLLAPWYSKLGKGALEIAKEGLEEVEQSSVSKYEQSKGYQKEGLFDSIVGASKYLLENYGDPELQSEFVGGMVGSGVTQGALKVYEKLFQDINKKDINEVSKKAFSQDINQYINSVLDPIHDASGRLNDDAVRAHLIRSAQVLNNDVAKDVANLTGNWQMEHMLEQEGFNKLYYEARENKINHQDATEYILGALKARSEDKMYLSEHKTPYTEYKGKASFMAEVEGGLGRTQIVYDNLDKIVKHYAKKNIELTPEKRQRVFEALSNHKEFQAINELLSSHLSKEAVLDGKILDQLSPSERLLHDQLVADSKGSISPKIDIAIQKEALKDSKLNQIYQLSYVKVIDDLLEEPSLKKDSLQHKANKAADTAEQAQIPVETVIEEMTANPAEAKAILAKVKEDSTAGASNTLKEKTETFKNQMSLMFNKGVNALGDVASETSINDLIDSYLQSIKPEVTALKLNKQEILDIVQNQLIKGAEIFKENAGYIDMKNESTKLNSRYKEGNEQRNGLFVLERAAITKLLKDKGLSTDASNIFNSLNTSQILDAYQNATIEGKEIIEEYYNKGSNPQGELGLTKEQLDLANIAFENNFTENNDEIDIEDSELDGDITNDTLDSLFNCRIKNGK